MNIIDNKRTSVSLILISLSSLIITYLIKEPNDYGMIVFLQEQKFQVPIHLYDINIMGLTIPYKGVVITFTLLLVLGVYWLLYKTDNELKNGYRSIISSCRLNLQEKRLSENNLKKINLLSIIIIAVLLLILIIPLKPKRDVNTIKNVTDNDDYNTIIDTSVIDTSPYIYDNPINKKSNSSDSSKPFTERDKKIRDMFKATEKAKDDKPSVFSE